MKKLFTTLALGLFLGGLGFTANAQNVTISWGTPFTTEEDVYYLIPEGYYGGIKVATNSKTDITADEYPQGVFTSDQNKFMYGDTWGASDGLTGGIDYYSMETENDEYVYYYDLIESNDMNEHISYAIYWPAGEVEFTVTQVDLKGGGGPSVPEVNKITLNDGFLAGPNAKEWVFNNEGGNNIPDYYFLSNSQQDLSGVISFSREDEVEMPLTAMQDENGNYAYVKAENGYQISDYSYIFKYTGQDEVTFTLVNEEFVKSGEIELGVPFTVTSTDKIWKINGLTLNADVYIVGETTDDWKANVNFATSSGVNMLNNWTQVTNVDNGYIAYTGHLNLTDASLTLTYTGSTPLKLTFNEGIYTEHGVMEYMEPAQQTPTSVNVSDVSAAIQLTWGETVTVVDNEASMSYSINGENQPAILECRDYLQFLSDEEGDVEPGISTLSVENGESGEVLLLLFGGAVSGNLEVGEYVFNLPAGVVRNAEGKYNPQQYITINVIEAEYAPATVTPPAGSEFEKGEDVIITITFAQTPEVVESEDAPIMVTDYMDYEQRFEWYDDAITVENYSIVVNLGNELAAGTYYLSMLEGAVTVNGLDNEIVDYQFTVLPAEGEITEYLLVAPTVTPDPKADEVAPFNEVQITWKEYNISLNEAAEGATFNGDPVAAELDNNVLVFNVVAEESGTYTLIVPKEYVIAADADGNEYYNDSLTFVFVVNADSDGVTLVNADADGYYRVYNLQGQSVVVTKEAQDLNNLGNGIYIINGNKVSIRK